MWAFWSAAAPAMAASARRAPPLSAVVINGIKILLGQPVEGFYAERQSQFRQAMADMGHQFWTRDGKLSMIGQGRNVVVLIAMVFVVAAICARCRQLKLRIGCIGVLSLHALWGITSCWRSAMALSLSRIRRERLVDYNRYIYSYYIGWFFMALACLIEHCPANSGWRNRTAPRRLLRRRWRAQGGVCVCCWPLPCWCGRDSMILPQLSVLGFADSEFADRKPRVPRPSWCAAICPRRPCVLCQAGR